MASGRSAMRARAAALLCALAALAALYEFGPSSPLHSMLRPSDSRSRNRLLEAVLEQTTTVAGAAVAPASSGPATSHVTIEEGRPTVFFLGIFSTNSKQEADRRALIRRTMLSGGPNAGVCSLRQYEKHLAAEQRSEACRVVYSFVVGNNDDGPTYHRDDMGVPIVVDPATIPDGGDDIIYLNIKENMEDGKTPTFFKYVSQLTNQYGFDYIAKSDSDTVLSIKELIKFIDSDLPPKPRDGTVDNRRMYGGLLVDIVLCGGVDQPRCKDLFGKVYMAGQFYFLSTDLAAYVSSDDLDRSKMSQGIEDMDMGMWVLSYPKPVKLVVMTGAMTWFHGKEAKTDEGWMKWSKAAETQLPHRPLYFPKAQHV